MQLSTEEIGSMAFKAFRIRQVDGGIQSGFEQLEINDLSAGEVVVRVQYSGINYKDALAATGKGRITRVPALNGGIDLVGVVDSSTDERFHDGDAVLVCGAGLSETLDGGYSEFARVRGDAVVPLPPGLTAWEAGALGTAGFTAALAMMRMEDNHQNPALGPIVVTGATGGVGSFAIDMLAAKGFEVMAFTGKPEQHDYLRNLGASDFIDRHAIEMGTRPLERAEYGGAVDNVGGDTLGWLTRVIRPMGNIASIGLVGGVKLETTVMPFILRGVSLLGINSVEMPLSMRDQAWNRLATDLKPRHITSIASRTIAFDDLPRAFEDFIEGNVTGRVVVEISSS
jgi:acrylyl-CoA reductase (NADPH)